MKRLLPDNNQGVIILGGHVQALGIARILGKRGIAIVVADCTSASIARRSKYCNAFYKVEDDMLIEFLLGSECRSLYKGWVVIPTNDFHVKILSINKAKLEKNYIVSTDRWDAVESFYNKKNTYTLANQTGVPIPMSFYPENHFDIDNSEINFPCIIKPAVMIDFYRKTGKKVLFCRNRFELETNYNKALKLIPSGEIIIQEVVPGDGRNQFSACFLFLNGRSFVTLTACRMRQHPVDFGNATTYAEVVDEPLLIEYGNRLLKKVNYNGVCEIEFKRDIRDNKFKLLEVNPRTWKWHSIAEKTGTPFLPLFYDYLTGKDILPVHGQNKASFCHMATDIPVRISLLFKGLKYWVRLLRPVQHAVWSLKDPAPWFYEKLYLPYYFIRR